MNLKLAVLTTMLLVIIAYSTPLPYNFDQSGNLITEIAIGHVAVVLLLISSICGVFLAVKNLSRKSYISPVISLTINLPIVIVAVFLGVISFINP